MEKYIEKKKKILREFCIPEDAIDAVPWSTFENETQVDQYMRYLYKIWL